MSLGSEEAARARAQQGLRTLNNILNPKKEKEKKVVEKVVEKEVEKKPFQPWGSARRS